MHGWTAYSEIKNTCLENIHFSKSKYCISCRLSRVNLRWHSTNDAFWQVHDAKSNMEIFDTLLSCILTHAHTNKLVLTCISCQMSDITSYISHTCLREVINLPLTQDSAPKFLPNIFQLQINVFLSYINSHNEMRWENTSKQSTFCKGCILMYYSCNIHNIYSQCSFTFIVSGRSACNTTLNKVWASFLNSFVLRAPRNFRTGEISNERRGELWRNIVFSTANMRGVSPPHVLFGTWLLIILRAVGTDMPQ